MELLLELKEQGETLLVSVHDLNQARRFCDTLTILKDGRVYYFGSASEALSKASLEDVFQVTFASSGAALEFDSLIVE